MLTVWRAIALECLYQDWSRHTWPATRARFMRETTLADLTLLWAPMDDPRRLPTRLRHLR